jgi:hypothetical protein
MVRKLCGNSLLSSVVAVVIAMASSAGRAQVNTGGPLVKSYGASASHNAVMQLLEHNPIRMGQASPKQGVAGSERFRANRSQTMSLGVAPAGPTPPIFLPAVTYGSGGVSPTSIAVADLNGDGKQDLVVANECAVGVGVLLGNGDGTFQAPVSYNSGGQPATSVAVADVNGDQIPDLVVANCGPIGTDGCQTTTAVVGVLLGNGDGTFQPVAVYQTGWSGAYSVAVADVNGDSKPDLVVANIGGASGPDGMVSVLLGNGDGTFEAVTTYASGGEGRTGLR